MKKIRILSIFALVILLVTGCASPNSQTDPAQTDLFDTDTALPGYDAQNKYFLADILSFQETDGFFCGSNCIGNYLQYYDKASGITGVLCADPACSHNSAECGAYIKSGATFSVYDGKLYWIADDASNGSNYYLWQSDLSGTNRKKIKRLSFENVIMAYQPQRYVIHRGNLYMLGRSNLVAGTQVGDRISLLSTSLDDSEDITVLYDNVFEQGAQATVRFVGRSAYLSVVAFSDNGVCDITITKFNTRTGSSEIVYEEVNINATLGRIWVTEQGEVYLPGSDANHAYVWKIEDGVRTEIISWDGHDLSAPDIMDGIAINTYKIDGIRYIGIVSLNGTSLYEGELFPGGINGLEGDPNTYSFAVIGGDADKIVVNLMSFTGTGMTDYTIMLDVANNMKPTVLWGGQE